MELIEEFIAGASKVKKSKNGKWKFKSCGSKLKIKKQGSDWKFKLNFSTRH